MSDKIHCDLCDAMIPADVERLTLKVGVATGNSLDEEEFAHDVCPRCVKQSPLLSCLLVEFKE